MTVRRGREQDSLVAAYRRRGFGDPDSEADGRPPSSPAPTAFHFNSLPITVILKDDEPWFISREVCAALATNVEANRRLNDDQEGLTNITTHGGDQRATIISEPGLYRLIGRSNEPAVKAFKRWACHDEVLPAIRATGRYEATTVAPPAPSLLDRRWLIIFDHDGRERVTPIDPERHFLKMEEIRDPIRDPGFPIDAKLLVEAVHACAHRLDDTGGQSAAGRDVMEAPARLPPGRVSETLTRGGMRLQCQQQGPPRCTATG